MPPAYYRTRTGKKTLKKPSSNPSIPKLIKKAKTKAKNASIARVVKRVMGKEVETLYVQKNVFNQQSTLGYGLNSALGGGLGLTSTTSIIPAILIGDDVSSRSGNRVRPKGFYIKYSLRAQQVTSTGVNVNPFIPFLVRVIIYSKKLNRTDRGNVGILQNGSSSTDLGSAPETWMEPYNKDVFNIHYSKQYVMVAPRRQTDQAAPNQYAQDAVVDGAKSFVFKKIKVKGLPASLIYDDANNSNLPQNACMFMAVCVCNVDGSTGPGGGTQTTDQRLMVNADSQLYFTDA